MPGFIKKTTLIAIAFLIVVGLVYFYKKGNAPLVNDEIPADVGSSFQVEITDLKKIAGEKISVTRVIDGDTVVVEGGDSVRIIGVDADERGYPCYEAARKKLEELVLNREVFLEKDQTDLDQYKRYLRYIFVGDRNISVEMVRSGFAVARFYPDNVKYKTQVAAAEQTAKTGKLGCVWGQNTSGL